MVISSNFFVQPRITTISKAMKSLVNVSAFMENKGCTSEATQVCHIKDLAAALSYSEDNTRQSTMDDFFIDYVSHACFKILLQVPQILNMAFV